MAKRGGKHLAKNLARSDYEYIPRSDRAEKTEKHGKSHKPEKKKRSKVKVVLITILCILLALILLAGAFVLFVLGKINRVDNTSADESLPPVEETFDTDEEAVGETMDPNDIQWGNVEALQSEHVYNILLIGQDRRAGEGRARSDSMIICSINQKTDEIHLVSLLRDMYVQIPGYSDNRINTAYSLGGMELLDRTIETNFGIKIDGNVEVDFEGFAKAIDILGGIDMELTSAEANYINKETGNYRLSAGWNRLYGEEALWYSRIRKLDSDFGRSERQRKVIKAAAAEVADASIGELMELVNEILPLITTDLSTSEIIDFATMVLPMISDLDSISSDRIPQDDAYKSAYIKGMSVLLPDLEKCREYLEELLYGDGTAAAA